MKSTATDLHERVVSIAFQSETPAEQQVLAALQNNDPIANDYMFSIRGWVINALIKAGHLRYELTGYEYFKNGLFFFTVQRVGGDIGSF